MPSSECYCSHCVSEELYSRLYCQDCFDLSCSESSEDMHYSDKAKHNPNIPDFTKALNLLIAYS
jgi:hypothetical protein